MYVLGIVGGVASGKSAVSQAFARRGAAVLDADQVGHQVLAEPEVIAAFRQRWGEAVVGPDGQIVRREVAARVFGQSEEAAREREFLNSVTHPLIRRRLTQQLEALRSQGTSLAVIDAALLHETGWDQLCDGVLFVDAPQVVRRDRALLRGWSAEQFAAREASQWPVERKKSRATWVVDNSGPLTNIEPQVDRLWSEIKTPLG
jgi:dephospho-CoA kinase